MNIKHSGSLLFALALGCCFFRVLQAQNYHAESALKPLTFHWPEGKKMALSLTFDDARLSQTDLGIPLLDNYGVKGTFYISPSNLVKRLDKWKEAVHNGHEIGNHSLLHPCSGNFPFARDKALENYTLEKMRAELDSANRFIYNHLGVIPVSFAYPCGQSFVGRGTGVKSYIPMIAAMFETGRGWLDEAPNDPGYCDMAQLFGMEMDGKSFDDIKLILEKAGNMGGWLILAGHEIKTEGKQTTLSGTLEEICRYAMDPANCIWIDSVHNIASYISGTREQGGKH